MNCQDFNEKLHDYMDETLGADGQAAAEEHLRQCGACRSALSRERIVAKSIRHSLDHAMACLSLPPGTLRNVLKRLEPQATQPKAWMRFLQRLCYPVIRPVGVGAALLGIVLLILVI